MTDIFIKHLLLWLSFCVASICFLQAIWLDRLVPDMQRRLHRRLWIAAGLVLILGIIDHQAGIGLKIAAFGRRIAVVEGWYETRRIVQAWTIILIAVAWLWCAGALIWRTRQGGWASWLAMLSCVFLLGFGSIRMISLHQVDAWLNVRLLGLQRSSFLELAGVVAIGLAALGDQTHNVMVAKKNRRGISRVHERLSGHR